MQRFDVESSSTSASSSRARASKRTRSASSSTSSDDDHGDCSQLPAGKNELTLATLQMFPGEADESGGKDSFASQNEKDPQRIRQLMKGKVCHCSKNCKRKLNVGTILTVCNMFWSLSKSAQDCVLWGIQQPVVQQSGNDSDSDSDSGSSSSSSSSSSSLSRRMSTWFLQGVVALFIVERLRMSISLQESKCAGKHFAGYWEFLDGGLFVQNADIKEKTIGSTAPCLNVVCGLQK